MYIYIYIHSKYKYFKKYLPYISALQSTAQEAYLWKGGGTWMLD